MLLRLFLSALRDGGRGHFGGETLVDHDDGNAGKVLPEAGHKAFDVLGRLGRASVHLQGAADNKLLYLFGFKVFLDKGDAFLRMHRGEGGGNDLHRVGYGDADPLCSIVKSHYPHFYYLCFEAKIQLRN